MRLSEKIDSLQLERLHSFDADAYVRKTLVSLAPVRN